MTPSLPVSENRLSRRRQETVGGCLFVGLLLLSRLYVTINPRLAQFGDLWFGTDIPRHIDWAMIGASADRAHLHPLSFALYKVWGLLLRFSRLHSRPAAFVACAALPCALASRAIVSAARQFSAEGTSRTGQIAFNFIAALAVGPIFVFAPIPESHALGGAALLLEAVCVYAALQAPSDAARQRRNAVLLGAAAAGMSITNAVPAGCLLLPLLVSKHHRRGLAQWLLVAGIGLICVAGAAIAAEHLSASAGDYPLIGEVAWARIPHWHSVRASVQALFVHQFGIPAMSHPRHGDLFAVPYTLVVPREAPTRLQLFAGGLWIIGLIAWWRQTGPAHQVERQLVFCCHVALTGLLAFSCIYDPFEAYMVSPHAWPFVLVPLLLAVKTSLETRKYLPLYCLGACVLLSLAQTLIAFPHLLHLLHDG